MEVGEFALDQECLRWAVRLAARQDQGPGAGYGDSARLLLYSGQREHPLCQLVHPAQVGRLLVQLGVRIGGRGARPVAGPRGKRRHGSESRVRRMADSGSPTFYYDFNSPYAYLAAERLDEFVPGAEWRPIAFAILLNQLGELDKRLTNLKTGPIVEEVTARVTDRGLPSFAPPDTWPVQSWSLTPLRAALVADESNT